MSGLPMLALALLTGCSAPTPTMKIDEPPKLEDAHAFYAAQPRHLRPVPYQTTPAGMVDLKAETCGACHQEIYQEWRISTHARAWLDDPQFQAELNKPGPNGGDVKWMCVNCHTPLENQLEKLVAGLKDGKVEQPRYLDNPRFDPALQRDAITCATCHVRDGAVLGPWGDTKAPHPVKKDPTLTSAAVCTQCHQAKASFDNIALACVFDTGQEFATGPYAAKGDTCQTCHMPAVDRPLAAGFPVRPTRHHWFGGSLIPKQPQYAGELEPLQKVYPDGMAVRWVETPKTLTGGRHASLTFEVENARAGHTLPTGDPERFITVDAQVVGPDGKILATRHERFGTEYTWWPKVVKKADNRLGPQEKRQYALELQVPVKGPVTLSLKAAKYRISEENLKYHKLEGRYVAGRTFVEEKQTVGVK